MHLRFLDLIIAAILSYEIDNADAISHQATGHWAIENGPGQQPADVGNIDTLNADPDCPYKRVAAIVLLLLTKLPPPLLLPSPCSTIAPALNQGLIPYTPLLKLKIMESLRPWTILGLGLPKVSRLVASYRTRGEAEQVLAFLKRFTNGCFVLIPDYVNDDRPGL